MSIAHRPADSGDHRFIAASWTASSRHFDSSGLIQTGDWHALMFPQYRKILARPEVVATVAYETTDPDRGADLYGYIVAEAAASPPLVYYVYVKEAYRRSGIARGLFEAIGVDPAGWFHYVCSGECSSTEGLQDRWFDLKSKIPMASWRPRLGRFPASQRKKEDY